VLPRQLLINVNTRGMWFQTFHELKSRIQNETTQRRGPLVRHYFLILVVLISGGLISSGTLEIYFRYRESYENLSLIQQTLATAAAFKTEQFIHEIENAMRTATKSPEIARKGLSGTFQAELTRLLLVTPAIEEVSALDVGGRIRLEASRFRAILPEEQDEIPSQRAFEMARKGKAFFGPVYFAQGSEPYNSIAVPIERFAGDLIGILWSKVNLKYVWKIIQDIKIGKTGYAYIVTRSGDLVAHPDLSLVLRRQNLAFLEQVRAAFRSSQTETMESLVTRSLAGSKVFASYALIPNLDWAVIIEQPLNEAYAPIYASMYRASSLVLIGLGVALLASVFVARRVVRPLEMMRLGVERIGKGDLDSRLYIKTGDEFERLADEFNKMTQALQEAYSGLEQKISERTEALVIANQRLKELDKLKSDFVSNVSHELRTPLTAVEALTDNMLDGLTGGLNEKQVHYITDIKASADRLARLIDDILDLSVIEVGKIELRPTIFSIASLIDETVNTFKPMAEEKLIDLQAGLVDQKRAAWADRDKVTQVLTNLISNAIKFTPPNGVVSLGVADHDNEWLKISVSDTGPGIAPEDANRVFDEFYQVQQPGEKKSRGAGLGLAISRKLVEMHGGKIWVESIVGKGSTFFFTVSAKQPVKIAALAG
jgi:signal transduction histidine kinase